MMSESPSCSAPVSREKFKIALLICYFGKFPWYFDFFLKTCGSNPAIDFLIITDNIINTQSPNTQVINMNFEEVIRLIDDNLSVKSSLKGPYKLCDFKPAYGIIFQNLLKKYDFWGYGDIDVIYGDIRSFFTESLLRNNDILTVRSEYLSGSFSLFRNNNSINRLFERSKDYKRIFEDSQHYCFDECAFLFEQLLKGHSILDIESEIESMTHVVMRLRASGMLRAHFETCINEEQTGSMTWKNGILKYRSKRLLLYHLIKFKDSPSLLINKWDKIPDSFIINKNSIVKKSKFAGFITMYNHLLIQVRKFTNTYCYITDWLASFLKSRIDLNGLFKSYEGQYEYGPLILTVSLDRHKLLVRDWNGKLHLLNYIGENKFISQHNFIYQASLRINSYHCNELNITPLNSKNLCFVKQDA